jgi:type I restriction enzyme S subunit
LTGWPVARLAALADIRLSSVDKKSDDGDSVLLCNYTAVYHRRRIDRTVPFMAASASPVEIRRFELRRGDVLLTKDSESWTDIAVPSVVTEDLRGVLCGYHLALLRPHPGVLEGRFLVYVLQSGVPVHHFRLNARGITRFGISRDAIKNLRVPLPPIRSQQQIATKLDRETSRIDRLVDQKQQLLQLLAESRRAIIDAVTRGGIRSEGHPTSLDGASFAQVLNHWQERPLKTVATIQAGITLGKNYDREAVEVRPYLRVANVQSGRLDLAEIKELLVPRRVALRHELRSGDVLLTEGGDFDKLGRGAVWSGEIDGCLHQNHIFAVRCDRRYLRPEYLALVLLSSYANAYFAATSKQSTNLASTNQSTIGLFPLPLPPLPEQQSILEYVRDKGHPLDALKAGVETGLTQLQEYRSALITAAVTGQIDVRKEAAES